MYTDSNKFAVRELEGKNFSAPLIVSWNEGDGRSVSAQIVDVKNDPDYSSIFIMVTPEGRFGLSRSRVLHVANPEVIVPNEPKHKFALVRVISELEAEYGFIRAHDMSNADYPWRSTGGSSYSWAEICAKGTPEILFGGVK